MTWEAAMRWARIRAKDTGERYRVVGYRRPHWPYGTSDWGYMVKRAE